MNKEKRKRPIESGFGAVFRRIRKRENFKSAAANELQGKMFDALVLAAITKCVEFNVVINRARRHRDEDFIFVSGLRGICEDLISLAYIQKLPSVEREQISSLLMEMTLREGVHVQQQFFEANNPFQPVLLLKKSDVEQGDPVAQARQRVRAFWKTRGSTRRDGPNVKDMAVDVGLIHTYEYIYFASSNFVHFNPHALLRMGWGETDGPFRFSVANINGYYKSLASFYGSILFLGYASAFPSSFARPCDSEVAELLDLIDQVHRWPEVVTFEEMNTKPPLYLLTHALRKVASEEGTPSGGVLDEVRGLGKRLRENGG